MRKPEFSNLLKVLNRQTPDRPTLFEFFLNAPLYEKLAGAKIVSKYEQWQIWQGHPIEITAFVNAGYDYATLSASDMVFLNREKQEKATISLNVSHGITGRASFEAYPWPDPDAYDYSRLEKAAEILPDGMKLIVYGPGGVLENVTQIVGFESLCMMLIDDPVLTEDIFNAVGSRMLRYYQIAAPYDTVGALISNDDWGFKTQTMLSPADLRRFVFPWHKKIVQVIHAAGKPAILHSCGKLDEVMDDIIDDMKYDAKHSFEDSILPVEQAYEKWSDRIAILGGIDLDFICRSTPQEIEHRCKAILEQTKNKGAYALGTGNSIPEYVPDENFFAMINCVRQA